MSLKVGAMFEVTSSIDQHKPGLINMVFTRNSKKIELYVSSVFRSDSHSFYRDNFVIILNQNVMFGQPKLNY